MTASLHDISWRTITYLALLLCLVHGMASLGMCACPALLKAQRKARGQHVAEDQRTAYSMYIVRRSHFLRV